MMKYLIVLCSLLYLTTQAQARNHVYDKNAYNITNFLTLYTRAPGWGKPEEKHRFEGVDYEEIPTDSVAYNRSHDCHFYFLDCIRDFTLLSPVCTWHWDTYYFHNFYSICEVDLYNCRYRLSKKRPFRGFDMRNDITYYNGEDFHCAVYARRGNMLEEYFKNTGIDYRKAGITYYNYLNKTYYV